MCCYSATLRYTRCFCKSIWPWREREATLKGIVHQKFKYCYLLTLMSFQTCMTFFGKTQIFGKMFQLFLFIQWMSAGSNVVWTALTFIVWTNIVNKWQNFEFWKEWDSAVWLAGIKWYDLNKWILFEISSLHWEMKAKVFTPPNDI